MDIIVDRQSDNWTIMFSIIYLKCCSSCYLLLNWISIWNCSKCSLYFSYYIIFVHFKSSSISQLINDKSRDLQKLLQYFTEITTSASNIVLLFGVLSINFVLYSKDLLVIVMVLSILLLLSPFTSISSFISSP